MIDHSLFDQKRGLSQQASHAIHYSNGSLYLQWLQIALNFGKKKIELFPSTDNDYKWIHSLKEISLKERF